MEQTRPEETHKYVFTIGGRCLRCQRTEPEHVKLLDQPDPMTECPVDHSSLNVALYTKDGLLEWLRCPICTVMVEGRHRDPGTPRPVGREDDRGRGELSLRQQQRLRAWLGWADFNGPR